MPHKHKRREQDASLFDLPPSMIAKSLPVRDPASKTNNGKNGKNGKKPQQKQNDPTKKPLGPATSRRKGAKEDDTPKAFQRLMQYRTTGRRAPSGLETGEKRENKKRKLEESADTKKGPKQKKPATTVSEQAASNVDGKKALPKILPGEKLADFAARVDRSLPLSEMTKSAKSGAPGMRTHKMTKHEKHLRRLQEGWRKDEARLKEKEQAEREEREFEMGDQLELLNEWEREMRGGKKKKKNVVKKKGDDAGSGDDDPDPWAKLKKRDKERKANPFEVAQAPPTLAKPREIFKVRGGAKVDVANIPNAVGSLRRREELAGERRTIVEEYRRLMAEKRGE
ncbi:uncharacterized protein N7503_005669 [Penicillium pulvis]|uniref:uncharacterized protein n=1 Tax=Penicillium pulvis TaxID=1562058 RepID=UPI0025489ADF|nr:uncharacterized protein N7503_005669 [Penicillium pulvis]KAJ5803219.1 hypothetical protein N7503_005669 [Penicillium pulvis]